MHAKLIKVKTCYFQYELFVLIKLLINMNLMGRELPFTVYVEVFI